HEVGVAPGLRQRDADFGARARFAHQHRRVRAVEQQTLDLAGETLRRRRELRSVAREHDGFGPDVRLGCATRGNRIVRGRAYDESLARVDLDGVTFNAR